MDDPQAILDKVSALPDKEIDLGQTALTLAALEQPGISMDRYVHHLAVLAQDASDRQLRWLADGKKDTIESRLAILKRTISEQHGYIGDQQNYDDLQNINLIRVIDRAKGIPITLSILYIQTARTLGWDVAGLNFPGHFLCRIDMDGRRLIFDPFADCRLLEAADLRALAKRALGPHAELSNDYFKAATNREILIRLQNNIKHRLIADEDYAAALTIVQRMQKIAPAEFRLLLDAGVLYAKVEQNGAAIHALQDYLEQTPKTPQWAAERHDAQLLLSEIKGRLN